MADLFGEMRGLLARGPSVRVFEELCTLLERCDDRSQRREGIDYLEAQLSRWPDEIERIAPVRWSWRAFVGEDVPELALANKCFIGEDTPDDALESLLSSPHVRNLRRLRIGRQLSHEAIDVLHRSPHAPQLTELHISCPAYEEGDFSRLFEEQESQLLPRLQKLHIFPATDGNALLEVLSRTDMLGAIRELDLSSLMIEMGSSEEEGKAAGERQTRLLETFARHWQGRLEHFGASNARLYDEQVEAMVSLKFFDTIPSIDLSYNELSGELVRSLLVRPERVPLRALFLAGSYLTERSPSVDSRVPEELFVELEAFSMSFVGKVDHLRRELLELLPGSKSLQTLLFSQGTLDDELFIPIFEAQSESIETLKLERIDIPEASYARFFSCSWPRLRSLELKSCGLGDPQAQALSEIDAPVLEGLLLSYNPITEVGAKALSSSSLLDGLREFDFHSCPIQEDGLRALFDGPGLTGVNKLHLFSHTLSSDLAEAFARFTRRSRLSLVLFYRCDFEEGALESLVQGGALEDLHITRCELDDGDIQQIVKSPLMQGLERLILEGSEVLAETSKMLLEANPAKLTHVGFAPVLLGEDELRAYLERGWLWGRYRRRFETRLRVLTKKAPW